MNLVTIHMPTKKNISSPTRWAVIHEPVYISLATDRPLTWQLGPLCPNKYTNYAGQHIPRSYRAQQVPMDFQPEPGSNKIPWEFDWEGRQGTFTYRGKTHSGITARIQYQSDLVAHISFQDSSLTDGEKKWMREAIRDPLMQAIIVHKDALLAECKEAIRASFRECLENANAMVQSLQEEANHITNYIAQL